MARSYNDLGVEFKYLIVSDTDRKFGLYINTVGVQAIRPNSPYPIKDHPSGYLFNAQKGRILREYQLLYYCCPIKSIEYKRISLGHCIFNGRVLFCYSKSLQKIDS